MRNLIIFGCGEIAQIAYFYFRTDSDYQVISFTVNKQYLPSSREYLGLPVCAFEEVQNHYPPEKNSMFIALSYSQVNQLRSKKYFEAKEKGYSLASYISRRALILTNEPIGENAFILENNTVQPFVKIGNNVTLWSGNHLGHHSKIGNHCFLASQVVVSGGVTIGEFCFLGVNSTVRNGIKIGDGCVIGMAALIASDCEKDGLYVSKATERENIPASKLRKI